MTGLSDIKKRGRIYISGGISGKPNGNKEAFSEMEERLYALGFDVENPRRSPWPGYLSLENNKEFKEGWALMMRHAIKQQASCDAVVFLDDWEKSKGASIEWQIAQVFGQPCFSADLQLIKPDDITHVQLLITP